jgi:hypothetical protein
VRPRWFLLLSVWAGIVVGVRLSDFLSKWFPWFFALPDEQRDFLLVVVPLAAMVVLWLLSGGRSAFLRGSAFVKEKRALIDAERERIALKPKLTLIECSDAEGNGLAMVHAAVGRMQEATATFTQHWKATKVKPKPLALIRFRGQVAERRTYLGLGAPFNHRVP